MENMRYPGLQLNEEMRLQQREWRLQRMAWTFLYALLAAVVLGLLGNGPLSHSIDSTQDGAVTIEYQRFMRHRSPETLRMTAAPSPYPLQIRIAGDYIRQIEIKRIVPEPEEVIPGVDGMTFVFHSAADMPMQIAFHFQPETIGILEGWLAREGTPRLALRHFVYP